ncbi:2,5-diamino-6-ribosylamino-4(3H)-pyrimidinone 5'-phosphate reductase [Micromonospora sp. MH33]|uniref:dihydrofolate reductase family protein n=1 Tax=Micromonospora sp. MH33 TaxID=1945509 RepID=UPI000D148D23|nr:dihydrofolate reductase family protein [Micromonospora sp. MH33]PSK63073.1 2,5-diamino-6-ribosylamino-4(3H)-pyrimidinone 5'-phosphate reductase [Micromonospora sp. MH33]
MTMTSASEGNPILAAIKQHASTWRWGSPAKLLTISSPAGRYGVPYILSSGVNGQSEVELIGYWTEQCRRHRGIVEVQRDLGVDAIAVAFESQQRVVVYGMDRGGAEYIATGERGSADRHAISGTNLLAAAGLPDSLGDKLAELVWRLAGPPAPAAGARVRDMWPKAGLVDLDEDELHERYAPTSETGYGVRLLGVASIDGLTAVSGSSASLTSPGDQRIYQIVKREADLLLLGAETVRAEQYGPSVMSAPQIARRQANGLHPYPTIAVVTRSLDLDLAGPLFQRHVERHVPPRPILIAPAAAVAATTVDFSEHADVLPVGGHDVSLTQAIHVLRARGYRRIVCEGGPSLAAQMVQQGLVDEVCLTIAPKVLAIGGPRVTGGTETSPAPGEWHLRRSLLDEQGNMFLRYTRL